MNLPIAVQATLSCLWRETYASRAAEATVITPVMGNVRARPAPLRPAASACLGMTSRGFHSVAEIQS